MKILVVDGGARGQALAWLILKSKRVKEVCVAPGNGGTYFLGQKLGKRAYNTAIWPTDTENIIEFSKKEKVDLIVVGNEEALAEGLVNKAQKHGILIFGPNQKNALLESSKKYGREIALKAGIPSPSYKYFCDRDEAYSYVKTRFFPIVIKIDCLAQGKGVKICETREEAYKFLDYVMHGWGPGAILIEEYLGEGSELSVHAFCDKNGNILMLPLSQDHKRSLDGNKGENTGGMGAYSPVFWADYCLRRQTQNCFVEPTINYLIEKQNPFIGCLYLGLIIDKQGKPKLLEFNVRPGDPEWEVISRRWGEETDIIDVFEACIVGNLDKVKINWNPGYSVCVVVASQGYPNSNEYKTGFPIYGIEEAEKIPGVIVFHAGTAYKENQLLVSGGRALAVTALANTLEEAKTRAYQAVLCIKAKDGKLYYRADIGANISFKNK